VTAIDAVLGSGAPERVRPVHLGSLKSRIGHLEAAAGIAALVKTALVLDRGDAGRDTHPGRPAELADPRAAVLFLLPQYMQNVLGYSPIKVGLAYIPTSPSMIVIASVIPLVLSTGLEALSRRDRSGARRGLRALSQAVGWVAGDQSRGCLTTWAPSTVGTESSAPVRPRARLR
jgi:hypothetical protein